MLLALDIGNTSVAIGLFHGERLDPCWRISTSQERSADEYGVVLRGLLQTAGLQPDSVSDMAVCCVVPPAVDTIQEMARRHFAVEPFFVGPGVKTGLPILTDHPQEVGADRIVNAVSALARHGGPSIVVDFGTATTFDAISRRGEYLGGAIAPGVDIGAEALFRHAAKLPRVQIQKPDHVIGRNTVASIQSGLVHGYAALVDGIVQKMTVELAPPDGTGVTVLATGGLAPTIAGECTTLQTVEPDLTLDGLRRIWERNRGTTRC
ncbi:MAG: type III pantothenate kinase [Acidobacteriota bacterium]